VVRKCVALRQISNIGSVLRADDRDSVLSRTGVRIFYFATTSRLALRPTQPPIQWVPGSVSPRRRHSVVLN